MNVAKRTVAELSMGLLSAAFAFMSGDAFRVNDAVAQEEASKKPQAWYCPASVGIGVFLELS